MIQAKHTVICYVGQLFSSDLNKLTLIKRTLLSNALAVPPPSHIVHLSVPVSVKTCFSPAVFKTRRWHQRQFSKSLSLVDLHLLLLIFCALTETHLQMHMHEAKSADEKAHPSSSYSVRKGPQRLYSKQRQLLFNAKRGFAPGQTVSSLNLALSMSVAFVLQEYDIHLCVFKVVWRWGGVGAHLEKCSRNIISMHCVRNTI